MKKFAKFATVILAMVSLLGCQFTNLPLGSNLPNPTLTPSPTLPSSADDLQITPTSELDVITSAKKYYEALKRDDYVEAVNLISEYSLSLTNSTREDVRISLDKAAFNGWKLLDYRIVESQILDERTALIHVLTKELMENEPQNYDFWVAFRKENGQWHLNLNSLVDDRTVDTTPQNINGVSVQPIQIIRYVDKVRIVLKIENTNQRGCFWGWAGDKVATFYFGEQAYDVQGSLEIKSDRVYPDAYVELKGFYETYPNKILLSGWQWASKTSPNLAEPGSEKWQYTFEFENLGE